MIQPVVTKLTIYPVKGCQAIHVDTMDIVNTGPKYDRQWMLVGSDGKFISQRSHPKLALISASIQGEQLALTIPGYGLIMLSPTYDGDEIEATLHKSTVQTVEQSVEASRVLSDYLECDAKLVAMAKNFTRFVNPDYAVTKTDHTLFADAFPFLIISEESLDDLNSRLESPVPMTRFRPNIVIKGVNAYDEDNFTKLRIGNVVFSAVKKCSRCTVTTVDQETGVQGKEPLRTLSRYRNSEKGIMFGMNLIHNASGVICIGDSVELLK